MCIQKLFHANNAWEEDPIFFIACFCLMLFTWSPNYVMNIHRKNFAWMYFYFWIASCSLLFAPSFPCRLTWALNSKMCMVVDATNPLTVIKLYLNYLLILIGCKQNKSIPNLKYEKTCATFRFSFFIIILMVLRKYASHTFRMMIKKRHKAEERKTNYSQFNDRMREGTRYG